MATAELRGCWNPVHFGGLAYKKCRPASLRASGLPFLTEMADLKTLRVGRNSRSRRNQGKIRQERCSCSTTYLFILFLFKRQLSSTGIIKFQTVDCKNRRVFHTHKIRQQAVLGCRLHLLSSRIILICIWKLVIKLDPFCDDVC